MLFYQPFLADANFYRLLLAIDRHLAETCRTEGCPICGGALHSARYSRKPRGAPAGIGADDCRRDSFCCKGTCCRKRTTPPSLRFLGRKVYLAAVLVVVSAVCHGCGRAQHRLAAWTGVSRRTVGRWHRWWQETFVAGAFWKAAAARFMPPVATARLPAAVLERFGTEMPDALVEMLWFLAPITGGRRPGHGFFGPFQSPQKMPQHTD